MGMRRMILGMAPTGSLVLAGGGITNPDPLRTIQLVSDTHVGAITPSRLATIATDKPIAPLCFVNAGDITDAGTDEQDTDALAWMASVSSTNYVVNGGHDVIVHTPAQFATTYGMAGQNWTIELSNCFLIGLGMNDSSTFTLTGTQLTYLDAQLAASTAKPCIVICHVPLFYSVRNTDLTHYLSSDQENWYILPDSQIRTVLAKYTNAKAWLSGHLHAPYTSTDFVKQELVGDHYMAIIAGSSPHWTDLVLGEVASEPVISLYISIYDDAIQVRVRDHLHQSWLHYYNVPLSTGVEPSPSFDMQFSADVAAPLPEFSSCDVGVMKSYVPNALVNISSGQLVANGANPSHQYFYTVPVMYRKCGRALRLDYTVRTTPLDGDVRLMEGNNTYCGLQTQGTTQVRTHGLTLIITNDTIGTGASWSFLCVMRDTGSYILARDVGDTANVWKLLYVRSDGSMALQPRLHIPVGTINVAYDNYRIEDLAGDFTTQYGIATARVETTSNGEVLSATADGIFEHTIVAATGVTQEFMFRRSDDDNAWIVRMDQGASTIEALRKVAGVETSAGSAAQTWTDGTAYRIVISARGSLIQVVVNDGWRSLSITSAVLASNTGLKVSHAGSELVAWPASVTIS